MNRKKNKKRKQIGRKVYENHTIAAGIRHPLNRNLSDRLILGRALTKTFLHMPLMGANPIGFK